MTIAKYFPFRRRTYCNLFGQQYQESYLACFFRNLFKPFLWVIEGFEFIAFLIGSVLADFVSVRILIGAMFILLILMVMT